MHFELIERYTNESGVEMCSLLNTDAMYEIEVSAKIYDKINLDVFLIEREERREPDFRSSYFNFAQLYSDIDYYDDDDDDYYLWEQCN